MSILHLISREKSQLSDSSVHLTWQLTPVSGSRERRKDKTKMQTKGRKKDRKQILQI